jgi:hypothetical protein
MSNLLNITSSELIITETASGRAYHFIGLHSFSIEDPRATHLTRGSDGLSKDGIEYSEGNSQPVVVTATVRTTQNFYPVFTKLYQNKTRFNVSIADTNDGRTIDIQRAIIQKRPIQTLVDESEDSVNVDFVFESFNLDANYKTSTDDFNG